MRLLRCDDIIINRDDRQRKALDEAHIQEIMLSIEEQTPVLKTTLGLINPIVVRDGNILVAGECRLTAFKNLEREFIPVLDAEDLSAEDAKIIELEENVKRKDLTWQEKIAAIQDIHDTLIAKYPDREWTQSDTARRLGMSTQTVSRSLTVAEEAKVQPELLQVTSFNTAYNAIQRVNDRKYDDAIASIEADFHGVVQEPDIQVEDIATGEILTAPQVPVHIPTAPVEVKANVLAFKPGEESILCQDFIEWSKTYSGPKFNFIHVDFPYDAGAGRKGSQINAGADHKSYEDNDAIFWKLCQALVDSMSNVIASSAHIMFWYQTEKHDEVVNFFDGYADVYDLRTFRIPLIWHKSDNSGVVSDTSRRARHIYETALVISRGDRKIVKTVSDVYPCPVSRSIHPAEKPITMLQHYFTMFVSSTTRMLDPTCGSATSLRAAEALGAEHVLGFELSEEFHKLAVGELNIFRRKKTLADFIKAKEQENAKKSSNEQASGDANGDEGGVDLGELID